MSTDAGREDWTEQTSEDFIAYGDCFVPDRARLIRTMVELVPAPPSGRFRLVELCSGEGRLTRALLRRFPRAEVLALDGSPAMLESTRALAGADAGRLRTAAFAIEAADWRRFEAPAQAVLSSLAVHHLDGPGKRRLFADMHAALAPGGALILCDLVAPATALGTAVAAAAWDETVQAAALARDGNLDAFRVFRETRWNYYADPAPDPVDHPSGLFEQLSWLAEAGFVDVDVHWMLAGHAIFGGRRRDR